jgi:hypothetical protein
VCLQTGATRLRTEIKFSDPCAAVQTRISLPAHGAGNFLISAVHTHMHMAAGIIIMFWCALGLVGAFGVSAASRCCRGVVDPPHPPSVRPSTCKLKQSCRRSRFLGEWKHDYLRFCSTCVCVCANIHPSCGLISH